MWSWAADHRYWGWWKFIWIQKIIWRNSQKQNARRAVKYRDATLGSEAPRTTNSVVQCLEEGNSVPSIQFPQHQHHSWDDGLTLTFSASASLAAWREEGCLVALMYHALYHTWVTWGLHVRTHHLTGETLCARQDLPLAGRSLCLCCGALTFPWVRGSSREGLWSYILRWSIYFVMHSFPFIFLLVKFKITL